MLFGDMMKIDVKTEVRCYSIKDVLMQETIRDLTGEIAVICSGLKRYRGTVGELTNHAASEKIIADLINEKESYELSIQSDERGIEEYLHEGPIFSKIVNERSEAKAKHKECLNKVNSDIEAYQTEYNLKLGDELTLEGIIESNMPLTFVDSEGNKIITKPVTYVKIEWQ